IGVHGPLHKLSGPDEPAAGPGVHHNSRRPESFLSSGRRFPDPQGGPAGTGGLRERFGAAAVIWPGIERRGAKSADLRREKRDGVWKAPRPGSTTRGSCPAAMPAGRALLRRKDKALYSQGDFLSLTRY